MQVGWVKIGEFRQIAGYISKTVKDRHIVSIKSINSQPDSTYSLILSVYVDESVDSIHHAKFCRLVKRVPIHRSGMHGYFVI